MSCGFDFWIGKLPKTKNHLCIYLTEIAYINRSPHSSAALLTNSNANRVTHSGKAWYNKNIDRHVKCVKQ